MLDFQAHQSASIFCAAHRSAALPPVPHQVRVARFDAEEITITAAPSMFAACCPSKNSRRKIHQTVL